VQVSHALRHGEQHAGLLRDQGGQQLDKLFVAQLGKQPQHLLSAGLRFGGRDRRVSGGVVAEDGQPERDCVLAQ